MTMFCPGLAEVQRAKKTVNIKKEAGRYYFVIYLSFQNRNNSLQPHPWYQTRNAPRILPTVQQESVEACITKIEKRLMKDVLTWYRKDKYIPCV
jgi:hypothetical protein